MKLPHFNYLKPNSIDECLDFLSQQGQQASILAGGSDLMVHLKQKTEHPSYVVDINNIVSNEINLEKDFLKIGAMARLADISKSKAVITAAPVLAETAKKVGATQLQYMGTIGGNVCLNTRCLYYNRTPQWKQSKPGGACLKSGGNVCHAAPKSKQCFALYQGDMAVTLIALKSMLTVVSPLGEKNIQIEDFFTGDGLKPNKLKKNELVKDISVPLARNTQKAVYLKLRNRESIDFPMVGIALALAVDEKGLIQNLRMVVGGINSAPVLVPELENIFLHKKCNQFNFDDGKRFEIRKLIEKKARTIDNALGSARYRREMAGSLGLMALEKLCH